MSTEFTSEDVDVDVYDDTVLGYKHVHVQPITLKWSVEFEMRSWGVKGIYLHVPDQKVTLLYSRYDEATGDDIDERREVLLQNVQVEEPSNENFGMIMPRSLEFYNGKVTVQF